MRPHVTVDPNGVIMKDLPVVDPTTGLVDPDEVIIVVEAPPPDTAFADLQASFRRVLRERDSALAERDANATAVADLAEKLDEAIAERDQLQRLIGNSESLAEVELAAMAEKLRQAEAERDEARTEVANLRDGCKSLLAGYGRALDREAAYERLETAARAWWNHYPQVFDREVDELLAAVDALPPEAPVEAPSDVLQPRTDEMP